MEYPLIDLAISAFEKLHQLHITVHDLDGCLAGMLDPIRTRHQHPLCLEVKSGPNAAKCIQFEIDDLRHKLDTCTEGRIHRCHAGVVEWMTPLARNGKWSAVLFAGARRWEDQAKGLDLDLKWRTTQGLQQLEPVDKPRADLIMESLRQLAARIEKILNRIPTHSSDPHLNRWELIRQHLYHHAHDNASLSSLGRILGVSEDRCGHLVRELSGRSWTELVQEQRLRMACQLLQNSELSIPDISERCGFGEASSFNRIFKRHFQETPGRWRRAAHT